MPSRADRDPVPVAAPGGRWARHLGTAVIVWFAVALAIFALVGLYGIVVYLAAFCGLLGGGFWLARSSIRPAMARVHLDNLGGFVLLAIGVSSLEEVLSDLLGGPASLVIRNLPLDLVWVNLVWLGWLVPWYLWVPRRFSFTESEALILGGSAGILFEVILSRVFLDPVVALLWIPLAWCIYGVIFLLPVQLIRFGSRPPNPWRVPAVFAVTWGGAIAVALAAYVVFASLGLPT